MISDDDGVKPVHSDREILERVYARGRAVQRRRRVMRAMTSLVVVSALFAGGVGIARTVHPSTTHSRFSDEPSPSDTPTDMPVDSPSPAATCLNSRDPTCGPFYWDPTPGRNDPLEITFDDPIIDVSHTDNLVTITAHLVDPDAPIVCDFIDWGEGTFFRDALLLPPPHGAWETPPQQRGEETKTYTHTYANEGEYTIVEYAVSGTYCDEPDASPYGSAGHASTTIRIYRPIPSYFIPPIVGPTPSDAPTPSDTPTPSDSPTPTDSPTPSPTASPTPSPSAT